MDLLNKTNRYLKIAAGALLVSSLGAVVVIYIFLNNRLVAVGELGSQLTSLQSVADQSSSLNSIVKTTEDAQRKLSMYFITKATVGSFIGELETYAERAQVKLILNSPSITKDKQVSPDSFLRFTLKVEGEFKHVIHFLELIESMPYKAKVTDVKLSKLVSDDLKSKLWFSEITFNLVSYINK